MILRILAQNLLKQSLSLPGPLLGDFLEGICADLSQDGHDGHGVVVECDLIVRVELVGLLVVVDCLFELLRNFVTDPNIDERIQVQVADVHSLLLLQTDHELIMLDAAFVVADDAFKVGEVVAADGVVGLDGDGPQILVARLHVAA